MKKDYLVIDRPKWRTGNEGLNKTGIGETKLLNEEGYMCCLGMRCYQMGVKKTDLVLANSPIDLSGLYTIPQLLKGGSNSILSQMAIDINDNSITTPEEKEILITKLFAKHRITVVFKGKYKN